MDPEGVFFGGYVDDLAPLVFDELDEIALHSGVEGRNIDRGTVLLVEKRLQPILVPENSPELIQLAQFLP